MAYSLNYHVSQGWLKVPWAMSIFSFHNGLDEIALRTSIVMEG